MYRKVSIHLMLLFITTAGRTFLVLLWFQYISCYSLSGRKIFLQYNLCVSIHLMLLFICKRDFTCAEFLCFNTSHVTLYPLVLQAFLLLTVFIIQQNTKDCKIFTNRHLIFYLLNQNLVYPRIFNIFHFFMKIRLVIFITFHLTYLRNSPVMFSH